MPEQITPLSILYFLLHGAGTALAVVLFLYLLLCPGKAIAPSNTRVRPFVPNNTRGLTLFVIVSRLDKPDFASVVLGAFL